jgi:hypothetical protein
MARIRASETLVTILESAEILGIPEADAAMGSVLDQSREFVPAPDVASIGV